MLLPVLVASAVAYGLLVLVAAFLSVPPQIVRWHRPVIAIVITLSFPLMAIVWLRKHTRDTLERLAAEKRPLDL